jgi:plastocyanin
MANDSFATFAQVSALDYNDFLVGYRNISETRISYAGLLTTFTEALSTDPAKVNSVYTTVNSFSATWEESAEILPTVINYLSTNNVLLSAASVTQDLVVSGDVTIFGNLTAFGNTIFTNVSYVTSISASFDDLFVLSLTATNIENTKLDSSYSSLNANSGKYESTYTSLNANSGKYESVYTTTNINSANWNSTYTTLSSNSAGWVVGPASSTDNAVARYDLATGKLLQDSLVTVSDTGAITAPSVGSVIPFYYANTGAFPSASTYHGAVAHSHATGKMYYAHGGNWIELANVSEIPAPGITTFSATTDAIAAGLTIDEIAYPAITMLDVTHSGRSANLFNNQYSGNNPTIYVISGTTIGFKLNVAGHPFLIRYSGANYDTGLIHVTTAGVVTTGASAQGKTSGTLYWQVPANISGTYGYLCQTHTSTMIGTITVKDIASI